MNQICNGFIARAYRIRVHGALDQKLTDSIARGLQKSWPYCPSALLVTINSPGGSITQARSIADLLRLYSNRYNVPIVTFAEDQCLNSANLILTSGSKCYASPFSMIGDMGYVWSSLWLDRFAKKYDIKQEYVYSPQNKVKYNPFEPMKESHEKWLQNYLYENEHSLKSAVTENREQHFLRNGLDKAQLDEKVFNVGITDPENYVKAGLLDGLKTLDQQIKQRYSSSKIKEVNPPVKSPRDFLRRSLVQ